MKIIYRKKIGLKIADVWEPNDAWREDVECDIAYLHGCVEKETDSGFIIQHTLLTNLHQSEEELRNNIKSKNFRYEIRRAEKDGVHFLFYDSKQLMTSPDLLQKFCRCYQDMYKEKDMDNTLSLKMLYDYVMADAMILSVAIHEDEPIVFHSYVDCGKSVRLWHSCSNFRSERELANLIGRANKRLHWEDWLYFKGNGYSIYDWGGVFDFNSENGIDQFKQSFGGEQCDYYNGKLGVSILGKIALKLKK